MLLVADVKPAWPESATEEQGTLFGIDLLNIPISDIPAVTDVDYSARVQTVHGDINSCYTHSCKPSEPRRGLRLL